MSLSSFDLRKPAANLGSRFSRRNGHHNGNQLFLWIVNGETAEVDTWLRKHPRVHFHFTPTSASSDLVERFFSELTTRQLRRLAVTSVRELERAIRQYIARRNADPTPFTWTASVRSILAKVKKANETLASLH